MKTYYIRSLYIIKQEKIVLIPDNGDGLDKPRGDMVTSSLYLTIVVETPVIPPTTGYNIKLTMQPPYRSVHRGTHSITSETSP